MIKKDRKIIFECSVGSKLYGTNRPDSDDDFMGVFLPSTEDTLSLLPGPTELSYDVKLSSGERNTVGDVDRKYYSLQKFLLLAMQGQSKQLEMLFAPKNLWVQSTPEWEEVLSNLHFFLSQNSVKPFIEFAISQSHKAAVKGENLNLMRDLVSKLEVMAPSKPLKSTLTEEMTSQLKMITLEDGCAGFELAGRKYLLSMKTKDFVVRLKKLIDQYGTRSQKAASEGLDFKSLSHAYRLILETETLLKTGSLSFPLPLEQVEFLKKVRAGLHDADHFTDLQNMKESLSKISSPLPQETNVKAINEFCQKLLFNHLFK